jgi:hypothetical protein
MRTFLPILCVVLLFSCTREDKTIDKYSYSINDPNEKLKVFYEYMKHPPGMLDVEYHLWYRDNGAKSFFDIAGPTDYAFDIVLKVNADSLDKHLTGLTRSDIQVTPDFLNRLKLRLHLDSTWAMRSTPEVYDIGECGSTTKIVFREESIIYAYYATECMGLND